MGLFGAEMIRILWAFFPSKQTKQFLASKDHCSPRDGNMIVVVAK